MSLSLDAAIIGAKELKEKFDQSRQITARAFQKAIRNAAITLKNKAQDLVPIDTGRLKGSIHYQGPFVTYDNVYATVGTNVEYAPYQEFGTGIYAGKGMITPKRAKILVWKGRDKQWHIARAVRGIKGKFYFRGAKDYTKPILSDLLREAMGEIIGSLTK